MLQHAPPLRLLWLYAHDQGGGITTVSRKICQSLARQGGCHVTLLAAHDMQAATQNSSGLITMGLGLPMDPTAGSGLLSWLRKNPHDVIFSNDVGWLEPVFPYLPDDLAHVAVLHDIAERYLGPMAAACAYIEGVVAVSETVRRIITPRLKQHRFNGILRTIANGLDFPPPPAPRVTHDRPLQLMYAGNMHPLIKGVTDLADVLAELSRLGVSCQLSIAGGHSKLLDRRLRAKGVSERVRWLGQRSHAEVMELMAQSDLLLAPSRREPFGMVTIEAMCQGCVPLVYDVSSSAQSGIIDHGVTGFVEPLGDVAAVARRIADLHHDRRRLSLMGDAGAALVRHRFPIERSAASYLELAQQVVRWRELIRSRRLPVQDWRPPLSAQVRRRSPLTVLIPKRWRRSAQAFLATHPRLAHRLRRYW